jgi:predicted amidohydrolase
MRINGLLNGMLKGDRKPNYVVLPELSIPRDWSDAIAYVLAKNGIHVIAGIEYEHWGARNVSNQVQISLVIGDPGYHSQIVLVQEKQSAAHQEAELLKKEGVQLKPKESPPRKYLIQNKDLHFGVLICSELTDVRSRLRYRGRVDALFVVEWNKDINSFSSLIEASALDIHCYVIQANNRRYGDCRIRVPHDEDWARDPVRIKGGLLDYFALGEISVADLRKFQATSPVPNTGPFKPVPDGFRMARERNV